MQDGLVTGFEAIGGGYKLPVALMSVSTNPPDAAGGVPPRQPGPIIGCPGSYARDYTILDWPGPETPFEIYYFRKKFLEQVKIQQQTDPTYKDQWERLYTNYSIRNAIVDYYRFDVQEAIEHYRRSFEKR